MSLNNAMSIATSGMRAAQIGLRTVSDNIANVNTPGYARKLVDQSSNVLNGAGAGVNIDGVRRAADVYLQRAMLNASAEVGRTGVVAEFLDRAQALFGDPSESSSFFNRLDPVFKAFATASEDPSAGLVRSQANQQVKRFFDEAADIGAELRDLERQTEIRITSAVSRVNGLLDDIHGMNAEISRSTITGRDASGAENTQSQLLDELSLLIDVQIGRGANGTVTLAAADGTLLTGENRGKYEFTSEEGGPGLVRLKFEHGAPSVPADGLGGGELKGLIELRDKLLPELGEQLGEFTTRAADALNRAHNAASTTPAPSALIGREMAIPLVDAIEGFTGRTAIVLTNPDGFVTHRVDINFDSPRTMSVNGGAPTSWTPTDFGAALTIALSTHADPSFNGRAEIRAAGTAGISIVDDPEKPSDRSGRGFSHYFGLNDLVDARSPAFYDTGLTAADPHGFAAGQEIRFRFNDGAGARFPDVTVAIPTGGALGDLLTTLNETPGVTRMGAFSLDRGMLRFTSKVEPQVVLTVLADDTSQGVGGRSFSELHGLGDARALRAESFMLRPAIAADYNRIAMASFNFDAAVGERGLSRGDGRGAFKLAQAGEVQMAFDRAGETAAVRTSLARYSEQMGGLIGSRTKLAAEREGGATLIFREAAARRSSAEGVNLDEELIQLTVYQQAFNASARLITAAKEMYDVLLSIA